jgi:hypothetical protein
MSNPKEKAIELMSKFVMYTQTFYENDTSFAKQCALIAVDEIRSCINWNHYPLDKEWRFWDEVKQEIEKL